MLTLGLLWYDDDARRPIPQKIAEAVARYQERVGGRPTVCQLNPRQAVSLASAKAGALPPLRLVPDETLRSNYFLVGIEEGDEPQILAPQPDTPTPVEDTPAPRRTKRAKASALPPAEAVAVAPSARPIPVVRPKASKAPVRRVPADSSAAAGAPPAAGDAHSTPAAHRRRRGATVPVPELSQTPSARARRLRLPTRKPDSAPGTASTAVAPTAMRKPTTAASTAARKRSTAARPSITPAETHQRGAGARPSIVQLEMPLADVSAGRSPAPRRRRAS